MVYYILCKCSCLPRCDAFGAFRHEEDNRTHKYAIIHIGSNHGQFHFKLLLFIASRVKNSLESLLEIIVVK